MKSIDLPTPVTLGAETAIKVEITPLLFAKFVAMSKNVQQGLTKNQNFQVLLQRQRLMEQCTFISGAGKRIKLTNEQVTTLDARAARTVIKNLSFDEGEPGTLLSDKDADGVSVAIHYKLGKPILMQGGENIEEVEFLAKTLGDLEEILAGDVNLYQTLDLITTVAKPVSGKLQSLPSWAVDQITLADGIFIMNNVLPRFLE